MTRILSEWFDISERGSVFLVRWPRDDGRFTARFHALLPGDVGADHAPTACGLRVTSRQLDEGQLRVVSADSCVPSPPESLVCGICFHESGLADREAHRFLARFLPTIS